MFRAVSQGEVVDSEKKDLSLTERSFFHEVHQMN